MTPALLYVDPISSYLALCLFHRALVIVFSYNNDMASKFNIPLLTPSHKESNLEALDVEAVDSQTLKNR